MFNLIVHYFARKLGEDGENEDGESHGGGFAGSVLDWSVNYGHGTGGNAEAAREMAGIQEKAEVLDEQDQYRR